MKIRIIVFLLCLPFCLLNAQVESKIVVTPQDFGAKGDGKTDDTKAFRLADASKYDVFVPAGSYVVNDFEFASSKTWTFQRSSGNQWFAKGNARLLSSTTTKVTHGAKIYNLRVDYNGKKDISKRPVGLQLTSHFSELHGVYVSYFYIGIELGGSDHCNYTKIYDLYSWYNYYCGVKIAGTDKAQVNFVSFYDCNVGSNGVAVHDLKVKPNVTRGYGFYIATANGLYISNADVSSNETAGIYIDNSTTTKQTRGLSISMLYAEHNKHSNIYYNNGKHASPSNCLSRYIEIENAYFTNPSSDSFFVSDIFIEDERFIPPTVSFLNQISKYEFGDGYSPDVARAQNGRPVQLNRVYGLAGNTYKISLSLLPLDDGQVTFQNIFNSYTFDSGFYYEKREKIDYPFSVPVKKNEEKRITFYVQFPEIDKSLVYTTGNYGVSYKIKQCAIENITQPTVIVGKPVNGATRIEGGQYQVYINGWKTVQFK